jgi:folate-binding protein YgfZ
MDSLDSSNPRRPTVHKILGLALGMNYTARMDRLVMHDLQRTWGATFGALDGAEISLHYGDGAAEYQALRNQAGLLDLSHRGRLCVVGADRARFLNGQVTNNIKDLKPGLGCYAALTNNKGKLQADLNVHALAEELLLDFEPGLTARITERLEKFIVADDVQMVDVSPLYGLLSIQGPLARQAVERLALFPSPPDKPFHCAHAHGTALGDLYLINHPRLNSAGYDLFIPVGAMPAISHNALAAVQACGGRACGWNAFETLRIETGIPRYGADMDETNLPQEAGIEARAVSRTKGCYIGQEVINRIQSFGQVTRALRCLQLPAGVNGIPERGAKLCHESKEVGYVTSSTRSPMLGTTIALGYVRKECNALGTVLQLQAFGGSVDVHILAPPLAT